METNRVKWDTIHSTSERVMSHTFESGRILVVTDLNTATMFINKDEKNIDKIDVSAMTVENYTDILVRLAEDDYTLCGFKAEH